MRKRFLQPLVLRIFYKGFCKFFLKIFVGVNFNNANVIKGESQFIIAANHSSHLDTLSLMAALPANMLHKVRPVAAQDYFGKTKLRASVSNYIINTLLIDRSGAKSKEPMERMLEALDAGYSLIIFPEGTRGISGRLEKFKSGIAHILALRPHIKYVPAYLSGMGKSLPKGEFLILPYRSSVNFGDPKLVVNTESKEILKQITEDFDELQTKYSCFAEEED